MCPTQRTTTGFAADSAGRGGQGVPAAPEARADGAWRPRRGRARTRPWALLLTAWALSACNTQPASPPPEPDWAQVEAWLSSETRQDRAKGIRQLLIANEDRPGTLVKLAEMPEDASPGIRHYTAACLMVTLHGDSPSSSTSSATKGG